MTFRQTGTSQESDVDGICGVQLQSISNLDDDDSRENDSVRVAWDKNWRVSQLDYFLEPMMRTRASCEHNGVH